MLVMSVVQCSAGRLPLLVSSARKDSLSVESMENKTWWGNCSFYFYFPLSFCVLMYPNVFYVFLFDLKFFSLSNDDVNFKFVDIKVGKFQIYPGL